MNTLHGAEDPPEDYALQEIPENVSLPKAIRNALPEACTSLGSSVEALLCCLELDVSDAGIVLGSLRALGMVTPLKKIEKGDDGD